MACTRATPAEIKRSRRQEERAYVLIEEARLRCEALLAAAGREQRQRELHCVHHDLGLSALHVSTHIPSAQRLALLARVHARCDRRPGTRRGLERTVHRAARELCRITGKANSPEPVELAHLHLLRATELLLSAPAPRPSLVHVLRARHLA